MSRIFWPGVSQFPRMALEYGSNTVGFRGKHSTVDLKVFVLIICHFPLYLPLPKALHPPSLSSIPPHIPNQHHLILSPSSWSNSLLGPKPRPVSPRVSIGRLSPVSKGLSPRWTAREKDIHDHSDGPQIRLESSEPSEPEHEPPSETWP